MEKVKHSVTMHILAVTNMYPTKRAPEAGTYVEQQVKSLKDVELDVDLMFMDRVERGRSIYMGLRDQVRSIAKKTQPDLIHVMYGGVLADRVTSSIDNRPVVVSYCGSDLLGEPLAPPFRRLIARYGVLSSRRAARRAAGIVVKSKNLAAALPSNVDQTKVRVIPNGVDFERFKPLERDACRKQLGWKPDLFHILFPASSINPVKRYDLACAAVEKLKRQGIQTEIHELRGLPNDQVPIWMNACDVVLLTSLHEGSPNVVKEALACDLSVVSVDVGDVRERVRRIAGCYIALPNSDDLANKLYLVHAGSRRVAGRTRILDLSLKGSALRLKEFYEEILASWQNGLKSE